MSKKIVIFGARLDGQAGVVLDCLNLVTGYEVIGFLDNTPSLQGTFINNIPVLGTTEQIEKIRGKADCAHIAIGDNIARKRIFDDLKKNSILVETLIHPTAYISKTSKIGEGSFIGPTAVINRGANLGEVCLINSGAIVEHDNVLGCAVHFAPGSKSTGRVKVGDCAFIGAGATILPDLKIGASAMIGAGATVVKDVLEKTTMIGYAAHKNKKNIYIDQIADVQAIGGDDLLHLNWKNLTDDESKTLILLLKKLKGNE